MSPLLGGRLHFVIPYGTRVLVAVRHVCKLLYPTLLYQSVLRVLGSSWVSCCHLHAMIKICISRINSGIVNYFLHCCYVLCEGILHAEAVKFHDASVYKKWKATYGHDTSQTCWPSRRVRYMQTTVVLCFSMCHWLLHLMFYWLNW